MITLFQLLVGLALIIEVDLLITAFIARHLHRKELKDQWE